MIGKEEIERLKEKLNSVIADAEETFAELEQSQVSLCSVYFDVSVVESVKSGEWVL